MTSLRPRRGASCHGNIQCPLAQLHHYNFWVFQLLLPFFVFGKQCVNYSSCFSLSLSGGSAGRRASGMSSAVGRSGRSGRRQPAAPQSGQSANSGESLGDDDDDI